MKWTCLTCLSVRTYSTKKGYKLWAEQPNSIVQIFNYGSKSVDDKSNEVIEKKNLDKGEQMDIDKKWIYTDLNIYFHMMWDVMNVDIRISFLSMAYIKYVTINL